MALKIEDYGVIGDLRTAAIVGANGSIDWLCIPRFDSDACFAALLGTEDNGHWQISPVEETARVSRRYRQDTLILETTFETSTGVVRLIDFMPPNDAHHDLVRIVEGVSGTVALKFKLVIRFDYGLTVPWVEKIDGGLQAVAGPNSLVLRSEVAMQGRDLTTLADFTVEEGERKHFTLSWHHSHLRPPALIDPGEALIKTENFWQSWCNQCTYKGRWREIVMRSLITLKALAFAPTGGIVAAVTTSLPEQLGGVRNWDYRFCWLRDATFTLYALMEAGYRQEAIAWSDWLLRAVAGHPSQLQIMYGVAGERRLPEGELRHLEGYEGARPVRIGNAASEQFQLDVYGEILDAMHLKRRVGLKSSPRAWSLQRALANFVADHWHEPDEGIWEVRGPRRHFTHSKVMAWVAIDRAVKAVEEFGLEGDVERWRLVRQEIHDDVCAKGYHESAGAFTQSYDTDLLDASVLMIPLVGFLPPQDPRVRSTVDAIKNRLTEEGLVYRYDTRAIKQVDGLPPGEGAFLPCSFWLVDCLWLDGRVKEAEALFEKLIGLCNPLGLLSEEYDVGAKRLVGNFPQAFSHVALINTAQNLSGDFDPAKERAE
ncbi:MAG: glycoside hydrolase family 15 protein [Opitutaceae bacterium]|nr:glycoside hydrolase family 15 protein [Opitutaceae bacterium]